MFLCVMDCITNCGVGTVLIFMYLYFSLFVGDQKCILVQLFLRTTATTACEL